MSKLLYITANVKPVKDSYSLSVGEAFIDRYKMQNPEDEIITLDLYNAEVPLLDGALMGFIFGQVEYDALDEEHKRKADALNANLTQFMSADKYVFAVPLWNYSVPPVVRAYFDNICISGKTFRYTEQGPQGLMTGKKALCIQAAGGFYHKGEVKAQEHGFNYIKTVLAFLGIVDLKGVFIEGISQYPDKAEEFKTEAVKEAESIAQSF